MESSLGVPCGPNRILDGPFKLLMVGERIWKHPNLEGKEEGFCVRPRVYLFKGSLEEASWLMLVISAFARLTSDQEFKASPVHIVPFYVTITREVNF